MSTKTTDPDEAGDLRKAWVNNEFTKKALLGFKKRLADAEHAFRGACMNTTDPKVAGAFATMEALRADVLFFEKAGAQ